MHAVWWKVVKWCFTHISIYSHKHDHLHRLIYIFITLSMCTVVSCRWLQLRIMYFPHHSFQRKGYRDQVSDLRYCDVAATRNRNRATSSLGVESGEISQMLWNLFAPKFTGNWKMCYSGSSWQNFNRIVSPQSKENMDIDVHFKFEI